MFERNLAAALTNAVDLVNTHARGKEKLTDAAFLDEFLTAHDFSGQHASSEAELAEVLALRSQIRAGWNSPPRTELAALANQLLQESDARPRLIHSDDLGWRLEVTNSDQPLRQRIAAQAGMALAEVIRLNQPSRMRTCASEDCDAVLIDLSRNQSRIYCDTDNCRNRTHVAAYRARGAARNSTP